MILLSRVNRRLAIFVVVQILDQALDAQLDPFEMVSGQNTSFGVDDSEPQALQRHVVVVGRQRHLLQQDLGMVMHLVRIARQHPLIEAFHRCQRRAVAQQHVEKLQPRHMPPKHHQAERQRGGQDQPDRSPQPRPERRRQHDGEGRQPGAVAIDQRLDQLAHDRLHHEVEGSGPQQHGPARIDGRRQRQRHHGGERRADIGHEAQQRAENAPHHRRGDADEGQPRADDHAERRVHAQAG